MLSWIHLAEDLGRELQIYILFAYQGWQLPRYL
jgi:hypothetical protein